MSNNIEHIFYINLDKRKDRLQQIESELKLFGLFEKSERFPGIYEPSFGIGCATSHLQVLKLAKQRNYKNVLIIEDDLTFLVTKDEFEEECNKLFNSNINFDVCFFAYSIIQSQPIHDCDFLERTTKCTTGSCYLVNQHYYDTLLNTFEISNELLRQTGQHWLYMNDSCWFPLQQKDKFYFFKKRLGKQRAGFSDLADKFMDYNC